MRLQGLALAGAALGMACVCAPALAGSQASGKTVMRLEVMGGPSGGNPAGGSGRFTLKSAGSADRGTDYYSFSGSSGQVDLTGKKGGLVLLLKARPSGLHVDSEGLDLWTGTWSILSGTRAYADLKGVGAYVGIIGPSYKVALHLEGFVQSKQG